MRLIGFIGNDSYDIILYSAVIASSCGKRVAVLDVSEEQSVTFSVPNKENISVFNYKNIDFVSDASYLANSDDEYNLLFINFGLGIRNKLIGLCHDIYFVTTLERYSVNQILSTRLKDEQERFLILRDVRDYRRIKDIVKKAFSKFGIDKDTTLEVPFNEQDELNKFECSYNNFAGIRSISPQLKTVVTNVLANYIVYAEIKKAFKSLQKGGI